MTYLYRCKRSYLDGPNKGKPCRQRHHFKKKVEDYVNGKTCKACGNKIAYMDKWQMKQNAENTCYCDGVVHPHRRGSVVWCEGHPTGPRQTKTMRKDTENRLLIISYSVV